MLAMASEPFGLDPEYDKIIHHNIICGDSLEIQRRLASGEDWPES